MALLFDKTDIPRSPAIKRMTVMDAGNFPDGAKCIEFECRRCGHNTGWIYDELSVSENKRGIACPKCNEIKTL